MPNPKNQFSSKEFNELRKDWYQKLQDAGFQDIEVPFPKNGNKEFLKQWDSFYFQAETHGYRDPQSFKVKADYYYKATQFLHHTQFPTDLEKEIWAHHSDGWGVREIARRINEKRIFEKTLTRDKVWRTLKELKLLMEQFLKKQSTEEVDMRKEDILDIRPFKKEDEPFIYSTWLQNLYVNTRWRTPPTRRAFFKYHDVIEHILRKPNTKVDVCCLKDDPDVIVGYCVHEKTPVDVILHWIYVRGDWQRKGIAYDLAPKHITVVTHMTKIGERIWQKQAVKPKLISLPHSYEILETPFQAQP